MNKRNIIVSLIIFIALFAGVGFWLISSKQNKSGSTLVQTGQSETRATEPESDNDTTAQSPENTEIPESVDPSSIQPYTVITENEAYKIRELNGEYYVTLYAIINRPEQSSSYRDQLREYKNQALNFMNEKKIDTNKVTIYYEPEEAKDL